MAVVLPVVAVLGARAAGAQETQLESLRAAAKANASDPAAALRLGRALRRAGHGLDALGEDRRGINLAANAPDVLRALHWEVALAHMDRHDFAQASTACKVLGALPGAGADGHACAADAHLVWQRASEALVETGLALAADPRSYEARVAEGRAHELALDPAKSEASLRAAIAIRDGAEAHVALGRVLAHDGKKDAGVAELRKAVQIDPHGPEALFELAAALGPGAEILALLEQAARERPSFFEVQVALGSQLLAAGRVADAKRAAQAALHEAPRELAPHLLSGRVALAEDRPDDAIRAAEAALKIVGNSAAAKLIVADADAKKGEIDLALEAYQAAWGLDHGDPAPLVHAAEACHAAGRDTSARAFGVRATQEFPKWGPAWAALGDALAAQGEKAAARDAYQKALAGEGPVDRAAIQRKVDALR